MADEWTARLDAYVDGELTAGEMKALGTHLQSCPECVADVSQRLQLKRSVQSAGKRYAPPPELRQKIQKQVAGKPRRASWRGWVLASAMALILVVAAVIAGDLRQQRVAQAQVFSELADLHVATLASPNPVDVVSTDRHTVKPWFEGKLPFSFNLPELQGSEFSLTGGRVTYLGQTPGAELIYRIRSHQISVFLFQDAALGHSLPSDSGPQKQVSFTVDTWSHQGLRYFIIGDPGAQDIAKLADLFKRAG